MTAGNWACHRQGREEEADVYAHRVQRSVYLVQPVRWRWNCLSQTTTRVRPSILKRHWTEPRDMDSTCLYLRHEPGHPHANYVISPMFRCHGHMTALRSLQLTQYLGFGLILQSLNSSVYLGFNMSFNRFIRRAWEFLWLRHAPQ